MSLKKILSPSYAALLIIAIASLTVRFSYFTNESKNGYNATTWDALGYYMYLPGYLIYDDVTELKWFPKIDSTYNVSGGALYQATQLEKGGYAFKYLGGVAIMELPFFYAGHAVAHLTDAPEDGFSWPYQYAILFAAIFWFLLGCFVLRKVLLRFNSERITAATLLLICLATNALQYVSVDGAMSHAFIFPLHAIMLWLTIRWHERPKASLVFWMGIVAGLATISRPTELIMIFIPLLWGLESSGKLKTKWALAKLHRRHLIYGVVGGILGILPQLLYWKQATGSFIYDVGSKWFFLNPWWRVLIGFEKGWFIYTPVAIFMVAGLFLMKGKPFRKAVITFCLLNIWIIISWSDWRYGASYSTRALVQSYPVFALALAALLERFALGWKKWGALALGVYLIGVNLFQIWQYNALILHYDHMNAKYYAAIYLDTNPTPLDYSLLDTDEEISDDLKDKLAKSSFHFSLHTFEGQDIMVQIGKPLLIVSESVTGESWMQASLKLKCRKGVATGQWIYSVFNQGKVIKTKTFRASIPRAKDGVQVGYSHHVALPKNADSVRLELHSFSEMQVEYLETRQTFYK